MGFRGGIYFFENLTFKDGIKGDKLVVFLNDGSKGQFLFLKTTSQNKHYGDCGIGCYSDKGVYVIDDKRFFPKRTYIQFRRNDIFIKDNISLLKERLNGNLEKKGELDSNTLSGLIDCFKNSYDFSGIYLELLKS